MNFNAAVVLLAMVLLGGVGFFAWVLFRIANYTTGNVPEKIKGEQQ